MNWNDLHPLKEGFYWLQLLHDEELEEIFKNPKPGIYMVNQRTHTKWFDCAVNKAHAIVLVQGYDDFDKNAGVMALVIGAKFRDYVLSKKLPSKVIVLNAKD